MFPRLKIDLLLIHDFSKNIICLFPENGNFVVFGG